MILFVQHLMQFVNGISNKKRKCAYFVLSNVSTSCSLPTAAILNETSPPASHCSEHRDRKRHRNKENLSDLKLETCCSNTHRPYSPHPDASCSVMCAGWRCTRRGCKPPFCVIIIIILLYINIYLNRYNPTPAFSFHTLPI